MAAIELGGVSKRFTLRHDRPRSFQELFLRAAKRPKRLAAEPFWALRDVTYTVQEGEMLGVIGANGSGKSTLLKLIARILEPTSGSIHVKGPTAALLELGAGFHPDLTGRENIFLNSSILGLGRAATQRRLDEIVAFAELERFIDVPVKHYSSGMYVRLGFSIATSLEPRVLLVDEILAVGDLAFQDKCMQRITELRNLGTTIVLVTHDIEVVRKVCTRSLWLDDGVVRASGYVDRVIDAYRGQIEQEQESRLSARCAPLHAEAVPAPDPEPVAEPDPEPVVVPAPMTSRPGYDRVELDGKMIELPSLNDGGPSERRWGSREVEITGVRFLDRRGRERHFFETGEPFTARIFYRANQPVQRPVFGLALHREDGMALAGPNTMTSHYPIDNVSGHGFVDYAVEHLPLLEGNYDLSVSVYDEALSHAYDHQYRFYPFHVQAGGLRQVMGFLYIPCSWSLTAEQAVLPLEETVKEAT